MARCRSLLLLPALFSALFSLAQPNCPDSVWYTIRPVQCYGLRNGEIRIDKVFGGQAPYFFSLDGASFSTRPEFERLPAGPYTLFVRDAGGCLWQQAIDVPEPEELIVRLVATDTSVHLGQPVGLRAEVIPEDRPLAEISWRPPSFFAQQNILEQTLYLSESAVVAVQVRDSSDCPARAQLTVFVEKTNLFIPNALEPGSNQNSWFTVFAGEGVARVQSLQVYNRAGGLIFEKTNFQPNDLTQGWNGRYRGQPAQPGVYIWAAVVEYVDGSTERQSGTLTVLQGGN